MKKTLISISQISRYFEFLSYYFFVSREEKILYLKNLKKSKLLEIVLSLSSIKGEDNFNRFKIIEKDWDKKEIDTNTSSLFDKA